MRPERKRERLQSAGLARARMYLKAHLEWLDGWPVAQEREKLEWRTRPTVARGLGRIITVDRERLRQTETIFRKLAEQFPRAMPRIVGDMDAWSERVLSTLERLKRAVHHGEPLLALEAAPWQSLPHPECDRVEQLLRRWPELRQTLRAVIWSGIVWQEPRNGLLDAVQTHAQPLADWLAAEPEEQDQTTLLLLVDQVRIDGDDAAEFVFTILGDAARRAVVTTGYNSRVSEFIADLKRWREVSSPPDRPQPGQGEWRDEAVQFVHWLAGQKRTVRHRAARLVRLLPVAPLLEDWSAAWVAFFTTASATIRSLCDFGKQVDAKTFHLEVQRVASELEQEPTPPLDTLRPEQLLDPLRKLSADGSDALNEALTSFLTAIPLDGRAGLTTRRARLLRFVALIEVDANTQYPNWRQAVIEYLRLSADFFRRHRDQAWCARPWEGVIDAWPSGYLWHSPRETVQFHLTDERERRVFFEALARLAGHPGYSFHHNDLIAWLVHLTPEVDGICRRYCELANADLLDEVSQSCLQLAATLETEEGCLAELCRLAKPVFEESRDISESSVALATMFSSAGWPRLVPDLLRQQRAAEFARLASLCAALGSTIPWPQPTQRPASALLPAWAKRFPADWHSILAELAAVMPNAQRTVERLLVDVCPSHERLEGEIAMLEIKTAVPGAAPTLHQRLANLRQRRDQPRPITPQALARSRRKLEESLARSVWDDLRQRLEAALVGLLAEQADGGRFVRCLTLPRHVDLIRGVLGLRDPHRALGLRLLRRRWGGETWNPEEAPENRQFADRMAMRGIRLEPWTAGRPLRFVTAPDGQTITLAFERDEVEMLLMGHYFDTCLSTDGSNFFSAVVNAVDLNKQVLYARDARGSVVGRCLFAIGDGGTLLTFHPYCHRSDFPFEDHVAAVAGELAIEMRTVVSHTDHVSPLVTRDWYDDGARDLGAISREDSAVRSALRVATNETVKATLNAALAPAGLTAPALGLVVDLPEFAAHPALIEPLLPLVHEWEHKLPATALLTAARLAQEIGLVSAAARLLLTHAPPWAIRRLRDNGAVFTEVDAVLRSLIACHPAVALRVLRQSRPRAVRCDDEETDDNRRELLVLCLEGLGRKNHAARLKRSQS